MMRILTLPTLLLSLANGMPAPRIVGTPPADAGRGLVRVSATVIRHYDGDRKHPGYLVSRAHRKTRKYEKNGLQHPVKHSGIARESPSLVRNPNSGEFIRIQPLKEPGPGGQIQQAAADFR